MRSAAPAAIIILLVAMTTILRPRYVGDIAEVQRQLAGMEMRDLLEQELIVHGEVCVSFKGNEIDRHWKAVEDYGVWHCDRPADLDGGVRTGMLAP